MPRTASAAVAEKVNLSKQERLVRLANKRVPKAIKALQLVAALAKYNPSTPQVNSIVDRLNKEMEAVVSTLYPKPEEPEEKETEFAL